MNHIDIKNDRELLGMPAKKRYTPPRILILLFAALIVFLAAGGAGRLIGIRIMSNQQQTSISHFQTINENYDPEELLPILRQLKTQTARGNAETKLLYSFACSYAAEFFPDRSAWLQEALLQINLVLQQKISNPEIYHAAIIQQAALLFELGHESTAFSSLQRLNQGISGTELLSMNPAEAQGGINFYNMYAYILATANNPQIRDPELALKLIKKITVEPDGRNAAYLDTLAEAYFANDRREDALRVQRFALGRADYDTLWSLTSHYARFLQDK